MLINRKIKLLYWNYPNFGDALNPFLINRLSNKKTVYKGIYNGKIDFLRNLKRCLWSGRFSDIKHICFPCEKVLLAVGSILSLSRPNNIVWGTGFMNEDEIFRGGKIYAVRGKYTQKKLENIGVYCPKVFGDPALLLPLIIAPSELRNNKIAIIPHWTETSFFKQKYGNRYKIIDLNTDNTEKIVAEITSCEKILSTSLHGLIVSHAYSIPAIWIKEGGIGTDGFKFKDYFSSVGINEYDGFTNYNEILNDEHSIYDFFNNHKLISLPQTSIFNVQKKLLENAPFKIDKNILNKFKI